jgi:hypothetical protein
MNHNVIPINDEGLRIIANLGQSYDALKDEINIGASVPSNVHWKTVAGRDYLYVKDKSSIEPKSAGPRNTKTEELYAKYIAEIQSHESRIQNLNASTLQHCLQYRALRLPVITSLPAKILRDLDLRGHLGSNLFVAGTNAFPAYEIEARERFAHGLDETEDFDLGWCRGAEISFGGDKPLKGSPLFEAAARADKSFRINIKKPYQAVNSSGYEVELLTAPSMFSSLSKDEIFNPMAVFNEQEWLLRGKPIRYVICANDNTPAPLFVPDPRWMGLHKIWLSRKPERAPGKKDKDAKQGDLLLDAVARKMQIAYPLDVDFVMSLPEELLPIFNEWASKHQYVPQKSEDKPSWW